MATSALVSLLLLTIAASTASAQGGIASCCLKLSDTEIQRVRLKSYYHQYAPPCPIRAIVFTSLKGKRICGDPGKVWTKTSMAYLNRRNWQLQQATPKHHRSHILYKN
ncbi:monocyte chemotactic protein 1B-like [Pseudoliparis swirei]|uniref:monocyte chemotactic protein 1B-like n=1 Tax=Pseudoliparis swirei TaxID=2059687 RepID=UPI0024BE5D7B|nr:monocyte chemotactic protein 1B-like [Pseudoliparis swirei]